MGSTQRRGMATPKKMSKSAASRIQSSHAKAGRDMSSRGFPARAQSAGARNANGKGKFEGTAGGNNTGSTIYAHIKVAVIVFGLVWAARRAWTASEGGRL